MRPMTIGEIEHFVNSLKTLVGARLQKVFSSENELVMEFYGGSGEFWLWWELRPQHPMVLLFSTRPPSLPKQVKPLVLFLRAHAVNKRLTQVMRPPGTGRMLRLTLEGGAEGDREDCEIEVRLFPHGQNLGVQVGGKGMWWKKPQALPAPQLVEESTAPTSPAPLWQEWMDQRWGRAPSLQNARPAAPVDVAQEIARRERAIEKIRQELSQDRARQWRELGEWLKSHQTVKVPVEWQEMVDAAQDLAWNLDHCFTKAKQLEAKRAGTEQRLRDLESELELLRRGELPAKKAAPPERNLKNSSATEGVKARKLLLGEKFVAYVGKSARDNLELLRRARAWDLWLHLRDYPGSHCIIHRNKNEKVPDHLLLEAAQWVAQSTFGRKSEQKKGEKLTVLCAECRFVRPIRGDKMGRVNYQNETTLTVVFHPPNS
ncbi:MAG: NFACT family protein [Bdellovibrionales bacterium]|nr:NFACT family protein [Bdellovibrionales bacterium]